MDNRIGKNLPPQTELDEALAYLQKARAILVKYEEKRRPEAAPRDLGFAQ